jgi:hypothetical protein
MKYLTYRPKVCIEPSNWAKFSNDLKRQIKETFKGGEVYFDGTTYDEVSIPRIYIVDHDNEI